MNAKDMLFAGGILPALYKRNEEKMDAKDAEIASLKKRYQTSGDTTGVQPEEEAMKNGGRVSSASSRADGIAVKGKTRGKIC